MFGYLGKTQFSQIFEGNGQTVGAARYFGFGIGADRAAFITNERMIFDTDNVNPTKPSHVATGLSVLGIVNDNRQYFSKTITTTAQMSGSVQGATIQTSSFFKYNNSYIGWAYNSVAALSPATRKYQVIITRPDYINYITISSINASANNATSNLISVNSNFNLSIFPNLNAFGIITGYQGTAVSFIFNEKLESFYLNAATVTSITGVLKSSVKWIQLSTSLTSVTSFLANATNCEALTFGQPAGGYNGLTNQSTTLSGTLDISHMSNLKVFTLPQNNSLTSLVMPTGGTTWEWLHINNMSASVRASFSNTVLNDALASSTLKIFYFVNNGYTWSKNFTNSDFSSNLSAFNVGGNTITGDITLSTAKASIREFSTSVLSVHTGGQLNVFANVDISGLTDARYIDLTGSNITSLTLPTNTVITQLHLYGNLLTGFSVDYLTQNYTTGWSVLLGAATITYGTDGDGDYVQIETTSTLPTLVSAPTAGTHVTGKQYVAKWTIKTTTDPYGAALRIGLQSPELEFEVPTDVANNTLYESYQTYVAASPNTISPVLVLQGASNSIAGQIIRIYKIEVNAYTISSKINDMTSLTTLSLGLTDLNNPQPTWGQNSTDGLGDYLRLDNLVNMTLLRTGNCKIEKEIILPNLNKLTTLNVTDMNLDSITNISAHTGLLVIWIVRCPNINFSTSFLTSFTDISFDNCGFTTIDLTGRTVTTGINSIFIRNSIVTTISLPSNTNSCNFNAIAINFSGSTLLTTINNMTNIGYVLSAANQRPFRVSNCALNITFPFGTNAFRPGIIDTQNNGMSVTNVDNTIDNIYTNRAASWGTGTKTMNISGTNASPTGTYQAPAGFSLGVSDGTPASTKEQIYVLVNNYNWTITYT